MVEYLESMEGDQFRACAKALRSAADLETTDCTGKGITCLPLGCHVRNETRKILLTAWWLLGFIGPRKGLLEKKWTAVVRLQKKVMDLEAKVENLTKDLKNSTKGVKVKAGGLCYNGVLSLLHSFALFMLFLILLFMMLLLLLRFLSYYSKRVAQRSCEA